MISISILDKKEHPHNILAKLDQDDNQDCKFYISKGFFQLPDNFLRFMNSLDTVIHILKHIYYIFRRKNNLHNYLLDKYILKSHLKGYIFV